jgi:protocatechuate 3,4-dioxygenase beta subunit
MKGMKEIFIAVILLALGNDLGGLSAQDLTGPPRSFQGATITGQVVDARTFQPLRGAIVSATRVPTDKPGASPNIGFRTGEDGRFVLRGVASGYVNFYVAKAGYVSGPYASVRPAADGERIENVVLSVPPAASISGRVVDESGQPVAGARVASGTPMQFDASAQKGWRTLNSLGTATETGDDGQFWIGGLAAGEHVIAASPYGDTAIARMMDPPGVQSTTVKLAVGEERTDVDLVVRLRPSDTPTAPSNAWRGTNVVSGRVVDTRGRGIPNSIVLLGSASPPYGFLTAITDSAGNFQITDVPAKTFNIGATAPGYPSDVQFEGRLSVTPAPIVVTGGSRTENIILTLRRGAVISGTVTDEFGDPISAWVTIAGPHRSDVGIMGRSVQADARGRYRASGLSPGEYLLSVHPTDSAEVHFEDHAGQDRVLAAAPVFYPGEPRASLASKVAVTEGEETAGIDFVLRPTAVASINVTITAGRPVHEIELHHIALDDRMAIQYTTKLTGSTATLDVAPGRYRLLASADVASSPDNVVRLWSSVDVDADPLLPATVNMDLEPGATMSGRMIFGETTAASHQGAGPSLLLVQRVPGTKFGLSPGNATFDVATGTFSIEGIMPGRYVIQAGNAERGTKSPWMLKAATIGGRDVLEQPIDLNPGAEIDDVVLTVTNRIGELTGAVKDGDGRPVTGDWVVVFSADSKYWYPDSRRTRIVHPDAKGTYVVRALPAGSYIVALSPNPLSQDGDLSPLLQTLAASGVRVTLAEGEKKAQDLRKR